MTTHTCGAIFGPDGRPEIVTGWGDESSAWGIFLGWPDDLPRAILEADLSGYRFALVTVTEQTPSVPAPPPPGTRFDEEGVPMENPNDA